MIPTNTRGGDFDLHFGQDFSIGYLSHTDSVVRLYLQETFIFLLLTTEASVSLSPAATESSAGPRRTVTSLPNGDVAEVQVEIF